MRGFRRRSGFLSKLFRCFVRLLPDCPKRAISVGYRGKGHHGFAVLRTFTARAVKGLAVHFQCKGVFAVCKRKGIGLAVYRELAVLYHRRHGLFNRVADFCPVVGGFCVGGEMTNSYSPFKSALVTAEAVSPL